MDVVGVVGVEESSISFSFSFLLPLGARGIAIGTRGPSAGYNSGATRLGREAP